MVYGVMFILLLLMFGIVLVVVFVLVYLVEVVIIVVFGVFYIKFGNVDKYIVFRFILFGVIGVFVGVCFLSNLFGDVIKLYIFVFLFILGVYILL